MGRHEPNTIERASNGNLSVADILASGLREPIGDPPSTFTKEEREAWIFVVEQMDRLGTADISHRPSVELYCRMKVLWDKFCNDAAKGQTIRILGARGPKDVSNPAIKLAKECGMSVSALLDALLLTPKAQAKTKPPKVNDDNAEPHWGEV